MGISNGIHIKEMVSVDEVFGLLKYYSPFDLHNKALKIKKQYSGDSIDLCSIINAKSGACPEDCSYCAQSSRSRADIKIYPLLNEDTVLEKAREARSNNVKRFCIVTSGKAVSKDDLKKISKMAGKVRDLGLLPCATLGLLDEDGLRLLRDSGLERFHHNLETSERFFPSVCSTHTYADKLRTIEAVKRTGLSLCSGGIFGMGETWHDRIEMAIALRDIGADSVPINYLTPVNGTPLEGMDTLDPLEALSIISIYRIIMPSCQIRVCGGRVQTLGDLNPLIFLAGADGLLTGNYLTTTGREYSDDIDLIKKLGLSIT
jgi:biotin synthase